MKSNRDYPVLTVNKKAAHSVQNGHPWVYASDVLQRLGTPVNGGIADVVTERGGYLGSGFYNDRSKILVRILSGNANDRFDKAFFARRIRYALQYRLHCMGEDTDCMRLLFGDSDGLPGFICDKFGDVLVTQIMCLGIEQRKDLLFSLLLAAVREAGFSVTTLYERNDVAVREKEGLAQGKGFYNANGLTVETDGHTEICENGIRYDVDYINGQKTGFFLDQKYNRRAAARLARGRRVLDCFTHTGAFALNCAAAGADAVTALDISAEAIAATRRNAALNGLSDRLDTKTENAFDFLKSLSQTHEKPFDYIILDPPAFTKSSATVKNACRGYREINLHTMRLLPRGGYLATCSCSHFMTDDLFREMLRDAANEADVQLKQIAARQQAPDHPILWGVPETEYLKFYLFQVI